MSSAVGADDRFLSVQDYEKNFVENADSKALNFIHSGCGREETFAENTDAFKRYKLRPRVMRGLSPCDLRTTILGLPVGAPIGISPLGLNKLAHLDGEVAVARAAEAAGLLYTLSVNSTCTIEEVAKATYKSHKWFQIYPLKDKAASTSLIRRAEDAGYTAIVITADNIVKGPRYRAQRDPVIFDSVIRRVNYDTVPKDHLTVFGKHYAIYEQNLSWETVDWIRSITTLPVVVKGIQAAEDAVLAVEHGASAVWVSNHGGRNLDSVRPTIDVLPEVVAAVSGKCEVYLDGGVRTGNDVLKALALGARAVFVGRTVLYGLFQGGQDGVESVLSIFTKELESVMMLSGCCKIQDISPALISMPCACSCRNSNINEPWL